MAQRLVDTNKQKSATNTSQKKVCQQMFYNTISAENKKAATAFYLTRLQKCLSFSVFLLLVPTVSHVSSIKL